MRPGDALLLDVPVAGPAWRAGDEPRLKAEAYPAAMRRFLGEGMDPQKPPEAAAAFAQRVELSLVHDEAIGAEVVGIRDRVSRRRVLTFRRYHWAPLLRWLAAQGLQITFTASSVTSEQDQFGMGVVLLTV